MTQPVHSSTEEIRPQLIGLWRQIVPGDADLTGSDSPRRSGGDSLAMLRLISKVTERWQVELSIREIFDDPSFDELADLIALRSG